VADGVLTMLHGVGPSLGQVAAAIPASILMVFVGVLWLVALPCDKSRRQYVEKISDQAMRAAAAMLRGGSRFPAPPLQVAKSDNQDQAA
jgi:hypothetical protein